MYFDMSNEDYIPSCPWSSTFEPARCPSQFINENSADHRRNTEVTWDADRHEVVLNAWYNPITKAELNTALRKARQRHGSVRAVVVYCAPEVYGEQFVFFERMKLIRDLGREKPGTFCLVRQLEEK